MSQLHAFDGCESLSSFPPNEAIVLFVVIDIFAVVFVIAVLCDSAGRC